MPLELDHLSYSSIRTYMDCGLCYKFQKIDKRKPDFQPDSMLFGIAMHKVMADFNRERAKGQFVDLETMQKWFTGHWQDLVSRQENISYSNGQDYYSCLSQGHQLLQTFMEHFDPHQYRVLYVEEPFSIQLEGMPCPVVGYIDLIEEDESGTVVITEYKTAGKAYSRDQIDQNQQLTLYQLAARYNGLNKENILQKIDCLIRTKTPKFEQYYTSRDEMDIQRLKKKIQAVAQAIQAEIFLPNDGSWKCKNCQFATHCEEWFKA